MLKPVKTSAKKVLGSSLDTGLANALNKVSSTTQVQRIPLNKFIPNPDNNRVLTIPLGLLLEGLKIGRDDSLVYEDDGSLFFPEFEHLPTELDLNFGSGKVKRFYERIKELSQSIFNNKGLLQPVECCLINDGYMLNMGHRRWYAAHFVPGYSLVEAIVVKDGVYSEFQKAIRRWDENDKREDLSLIERISHVNDIQKAYEVSKGKPSTQRELAEVLGIGKYDMSFYLKIISAALSDEEKEFIEDNGFSDLRTVSDICGLNDKTQRMRLFNIYLNKGNTIARKSVSEALAALELGNDINKEKSATPKVATKITPKIKPVSNLISILGDTRPDLVEGIGNDMPPAQALELILDRLTQAEG